MSTVISTLGLSSDTLRGETMIVTGAGGGIGFEAARALLWLGAIVIIAEINQETGSQAEMELAAQFDPERVAFIRTDVGDESSVRQLYKGALERFGRVDGVLNNATIAVLGQVKDLPIDQWDASYRVNLRGPVLLAKTFLPDMLERRHGVFACVSSTGTAYLGGYETFKAAQVHLANTLDAELEDSGVYAYTIGPGLVPTQTASNAVNQLAPLMGMSVEQFFEMNKNAVLSVEEAGAGFTVSMVFVQKFKGMEISSMQALKAADIQYGAAQDEDGQSAIAVNQRQQAAVLIRQVHVTLMEQAEGWKKRSIFERQWVIRDFRKTAGMSVEDWLAALARLEHQLLHGEEFALPPLARLADYYNHLADLAKGYEKNPLKLAENLRHVYGWRDEVDHLIAHLTGDSQQ